MATNITFRTQLLGGVSDFCVASHLDLFGNTLHMVELVVSLARYKEEGVRLNPQVYVTNDMESVMSFLPGGEKMRIGSMTSNSKGIQGALKKTAPLATGGWNVYLEDKADAEYGIFRGSGNPLSVAVDEILLTALGQINIVKIFSVAEDCVEIRASNGRYHHVFLDHRSDESPSPLHFVESLISAITRDCDEDIKEPLSSFLKKLLSQSFRESHGCLIAVTDKKSVPIFLSRDAVMLHEPIDFSQLVSELRASSGDPIALVSKAALLKGMLNSDGIILFNSQGKLLGYNCFVKISAKTKEDGGARRRAFSALKQKIGTGLSAAFIQSQDGWTDFQGA